MKQTRTKGGVCRLLGIFLAVVLSLQGILPAVALAVQRTVSVDNHTTSGDQTTTVKDITIDGVDKPIAGSAFDRNATVTADGGATWDVPVLWVRDDLAMGEDQAAEGHSYLPAIAFFVPQEYALEEDVYTVTLSDSLSELFGTNEVISVYDASAGITYILPASLRDVLVRAHNAETASVASDTASITASGAVSGATSNTASGAASNTVSGAASEEAPSDDAFPDAEPTDDSPEAEPADDSPVEDGVGGGGTIVDIFCANTARDALTDEDLQWLIELILDYLQPQAVELLLDSFPSLRAAANKDEIGRELGLYVFYRKGDKDGKIEHETADGALAYVAANSARVNGELKYCYLMAVDVDDLIVKDSNDSPVLNSETGRYKLIYEGEKMETFKNTIVHELFHALMDDYNRTGMAGGTSLEDIETDANNNWIKPGAGDRYTKLRFPLWFIEGSASAVENVYQFRYDTFQVLRRLQGADGKYGTGDLNDEFTTQLLIDNYLDGCFTDGTFGYFDIDYSDGGTDSNGNQINTEPSRYVTGYLATLYLAELSARYCYNGQSSVKTENGVTTVDSSMLRTGLDSLLRWMHEGETLDNLIAALTTPAEGGEARFKNTEEFQNQFIKGPKDGDAYAGDGDSQQFVNSFLNYMLDIDKKLPENERPNGSILFDFDKRFTSPLDPTKKSTSPYLQIIERNDYVPSTVKNDTPYIGGGRTDPSKLAAAAEPAAAASDAQQAANLPMAAKEPASEQVGATGTAKSDETKPDETKPGETKPGETKPGETKAPEAKPDETKLPETKPGEAKSSEKSEDNAQPDTAKAADNTVPADTTGVTKVEQAAADASAVAHAEPQAVKLDEPTAVPAEAPVPEKSPAVDSAA